MSKPKVTLVYDVPDWAFHNIAVNIAKLAKDRYQFTLAGRDDWFGKPQYLADIAENSDIVIFLWRFDFVGFMDIALSSFWGRPNKKRIQAMAKTTFVTVVYDHLYYSQQELAEVGNPFILSDIIATASKRLQNIYASAEHLPTPEYTLVDGVDLALFAPDPNATTSDPIAIGWVGNSNWGSGIGVDMKGLHSIFQPAIERLRSQGYSLDVQLADSVTSPVAKDMMPDYYRGIDIYVCTSKIEGTPNPILEAMASGCAIVSTDVGIVPEVFGPKQAQYILKNRDVESLTTALKSLLDNPVKIDALKTENINNRDSLSWANRLPDWEVLFQHALTQSQDASYQSGKYERLLAYATRKKSMISRIRCLVSKHRILYIIYTKLTSMFPRSPYLVKKLIKRL